jgi:hypothetical protein
MPIWRQVSLLKLIVWKDFKEVARRWAVLATWKKRGKKTMQHVLEDAGQVSVD